MRLPPSLTADERAELTTREQARGYELKSAGTIKRMWRIPGRVANVGIWEAADPTALHAAISSLPLFPYIDAHVTALAVHYLEAGDPPAGG